MRAEYLFSLAHLCHLSPTDVDTMVVGDFLQYLSGVDSYIEAMKPKG